MKLAVNTIVYRIIRMPEGENFGKYGIHKYIIEKEGVASLAAVDELGTSRVYTLEKFIENGIYETEYTAKLGMKRLLIEEHNAAIEAVEKAGDNLRKFCSDYPDM